MKPVFAIIVAVVVGVLGFLGGMKYSQNQRLNNRQFPAGQFQNGNQNRQTLDQGSPRQFNTRPVAGEVVESD